MVKCKWWIVLIVCLFGLTAMLSAQVKTEGIALGAGAGLMIGDTDFGREDSYFQGNIFLRHSITGPLEGQVTGSFLGRFRRDDEKFYRTEVTSFDYRLLLRLVSASVSPYLYAGIGDLYYEVTAPPAARFQVGDSEEKAWEAYVPLGGGIQLKLADRVSLEVSGGYNLIFSDALNYVNVDEDDGYFNVTGGLTLTRESANADPDQDGLTNREEKELGTDKKNPDTDGDGLNDGDEVKAHQTNAMMADTDNDGLTDSEEVSRYKTNPRKADSDGDGLNDKAEVTTHKTNPMKADSDDDGLNDNQEVNKHKTDPNNADMDGDGLTDGEEVLTHKTDPRNADTDEDGLNDREELMAHKTDPTKADTDGGSTNDGVEVNRGTDPLNAEDDVILEVEEGAPIVLEGVKFASGKTNITPESAALLEQAYQTLKAYSDMIVEIRGYTDSTGGRSVNIRISQKRADAVRDWLVQRGIDAGRIVAKGYGPDNPIAPNDTAEGRAKNRRIEFYRIK